ncbi:MAG: VWA domain-containing protein [Pirellulaceae bacterium]|nr:VWA domain-containing protein [Pirellulaceae bacterium]
MLRLDVRLVGLIVVGWMNSLLAPDALGQYGVSSASVGMTRAGLMLRGSQFRVEEFVNYHRHELPQPSDGKAIALDVCWDRSGNGNLIFQIGLATASQRGSELKIRPLNLVLVIDCSGSMSGNRIDNVKQGIRSFVERLRPEDLVTIVTYESTPRVALEAACKTDVAKIDRVIRELRAGGSTNLHAGLMLGYQQAEKHFDSERTNRVILLTDGIANTGVIAPAEIAADSKKFNEKNIDLSTIGLGHDLDQDLLRGLSDAGRGLLHFIGDDEDIAKVFVREIDSLLSSAAREVQVDVRIDTKSEKVRFFGYQPKTTKKKHLFALDDLNHDATQVIVGEILDSEASKPRNISVKLTYIDEVTGESVTQKQELELGRSPSSVVQSADLQKNFRIARLATGLKEFAELIEREKPQDAHRHLKKLVDQATRAEHQADADVARLIEICRGYLKECESLASTDR